MVGVRGLEPRASCSQSRRATNCATPRYEVVGLSGRFLPKQARYQLRYTRIAVPGRSRGLIYDSKPERALQVLFLQILLDLRGGDLRRAGQIDHFALLLQKVEFPLPIVADDEGVDVILVHIR